MASMIPLPQQHSPTSSRRTQRKHRRHRKNGEMHSSNSVSSNDDKNSSSLLERAMEDLSCQNTDDVTRRMALDHLEKILVRWSLTLRPVNNSSNLWQRPRAALVSFGSFRLGVHRSDSDLDVLALCPPSCTREDFFTGFVEQLRSEPEISQVHPIPTAYTPVVKFVLAGLQIDMLFARLEKSDKLLSYQQKRVSPLVQGVIPSQSPRLEYMIDDDDLQGLDAAGVRSLNGARVSQVLLQTVPNLPNYRTVLKAVKEWAVQAGIYSNVLGFLGGVNWAILVAWICIRHPQSSPDAILEAFFGTFANWKWPTPVLLAPIQETPPSGAVSLPAWNPQRNRLDGLHIMPIITPAYPSMNSAYNVGIPQLRRINDEMLRACRILKDKKRRDYTELFKPSDFFSRHKNFLQITIRAADRQDFVEWFRLVESRIRLLILNLETPEVHAWPFGKFFERKYNKSGECAGMGQSPEDCMHESNFFIGLWLAPDIDGVNLRHLTSDFMHKVNTWEGRKPGMDLALAHVTGDMLPAYLTGEDRGVATLSFDDDQSLTSESSGPIVEGSRSAQPLESRQEETASPTPTIMLMQTGSPNLMSPTKKCRMTAQTV